MAQFLNTQTFYQSILNMVNSCTDELVIIVPYIKMTDAVFKALVTANSRGVETTLVYREKQVNKEQLIRLYRLDNINILHHPNVHCKMYYDGSKVIIGSLNLYDYSIDNNREMGVLVEVDDLTKSEIEHFTIEDAADNAYGDYDSLVQEIQDIFNGSSIEQSSKTTLKEGFKIDIVKNRRQQHETQAAELTTVFLNKKFVCLMDNDTYNITCNNFFDKINVSYEGNRFRITTSLTESKMKSIFPDYEMFLRTKKGLLFKFYPDYYRRYILIYLDRSNSITREIVHGEDTDYYRAFKIGLEAFFAQYRDYLK